MRDACFATHPLRPSSPRSLEAIWVKALYALPFIGKHPITLPMMIALHAYDAIANSSNQIIPAELRSTVIYYKVSLICAMTAWTRV